MLFELENRELRSFRSKSFFSKFFRYTSNSFFSTFSRFSISNSLQQNQSDTLIFRELLNIIASKCSRIRNNKYLIHNRFIMMYLRNDKIKFFKLFDHFKKHVITLNHVETTLKIEKISVEIIFSK